jgi:hypothetical protein
MLFSERNTLADKLLADASTEGQQIVLMGSGVWFQALECALYRLCNEYYPGHTLGSVRNPLFNSTFYSGGSVKCLDLKDRDNIKLLNSNTYSVPEMVYLVEDALGVHAYIWNEVVSPFLDGTACQVVYLGDRNAESQ